MGHKSKKTGTNFNGSLGLKVTTLIDNPQQTIKFMTIRKSDWKRIKRMVSELKQSKTIWGNIGWSCLGGFISFLASALAIDNTQSIKTYLFLTSLFFLILGITFLLFQKNNNEDIQKQMTSIKTEMDDIENGDGE